MSKVIATSMVLSDPRCVMLRLRPGDAFLDASDAVVVEVLVLELGLSDVDGRAFSDESAETVVDAAAGNLVEPTADACAVGGEGYGEQ
jgi:hypothetical protein